MQGTNKKLLPDINCHFMSIKVLTVHFSIKMANIVENCCNYTKPTIISALSREAGTELTAENKLCSVSAVPLLAAEHRLLPHHYSWDEDGGEGRDVQKECT